MLLTLANLFRKFDNLIERKVKFKNAFIFYFSNSLNKGRVLVNWSPFFETESAMPAKFGISNAV